MSKSPTVGVEPIDRLEEKVRRLVGLLEQLKTDHARALEDNRRLGAQVEALNDRLQAAESASTEVTTLREERDLVRARVTEILGRLEALEL
jgi:regulator of replication initiation timing